MVTRRLGRGKDLVASGFCNYRCLCGSFPGRWRHSVQATIEELDSKELKWPSSWRRKQKNTDHPAWQSRPPSSTLRKGQQSAKRTAEHRSFRDKMDHRSPQISLRPPFQPTCPTPHPQLNQSKSERNNVTLLFFMELLISNEMAKKKKKIRKGDRA